MITGWIDECVGRADQKRNARERVINILAADCLHECQAPARSLETSRAGELENARTPTQLAVDNLARGGIVENIKLTVHHRVLDKYHVLPRCEIPGIGRFQLIGIGVVCIDRHRIDLHVIGTDQPDLEPVLGMARGDAIDNDRVPIGDRWCW